MPTTATVVLSWPANPADEQVSSYNVYRDGTVVGSPTSPGFTDTGVAPGVHSYEVAAVNIWGEGPHSDPVTTPAPCTKVVNVTINVSVTVTP